MIESVRPPAAGVVDVWFVDLAGTDQSAAGLDEEELVRYSRYRHAADAGRFAARRKRLRRLLARYAGLSPELIVYENRCRFCGGNHGKPRLARRSDLQFTASSSGDIALFAVGTSAPLGADVELLERAPADAEGIARLVLAPSELAALLTLPAESRPHAFLSAWTRKEAWAKMDGRGIALELRTVVVWPEVLTTTRDRVVGFELPQMVAAVAAGDPIREVRTRWLQDDDAEGAGQQG